MNKAREGVAQNTSEGMNQCKGKEEQSTVKMVNQSRGISTSRRAIKAREHMVQYTSEMINLARGKEEESTSKIVNRAREKGDKNTSQLMDQNRNVLEQLQAGKQNILDSKGYMDITRPAVSVNHFENDQIFHIS